MRAIIALALSAGFGMAGFSAHAAPTKLSKDKMATVVAGAIVQVNGGGNTPGGNANGVPSTNPTGKPPPGHNK